jgi:hypothetical protein
MASSVEKTLSDNDVGLTNSHQAGFLIPKDYVKKGFFELLPNDVRNPRLMLEFFDVKYGTSFWLSYIFYNNKFFGGTRNEYRLTSLITFVREHGLRSGDKVIITKIAPRKYEISTVKVGRGPKVLSKESWSAIYGEEPTL